MITCEGHCSRMGHCTGPIARVHVEYNGKDWGYFWYCKTAISVDRKAGMTVSLLGPAPEETRMNRIPKGPKASEIAARLAEERGLYYGWSVFGGDWYVGTADQLDAIGVCVPMPCLSIQERAE